MNKTQTNGDLRPTPATARGFVVPPDAITLPIVVDTNEERSGLPDCLRNRGLVIELRRLDVGDVAIGDRIRIERKTVPDLLASVRQGRLFDQAYRLRVCGRPLVLIEGDPYELVHHADAAQVRGAVLSLLVGYRVPVLQTGSLEETAACVVHLALQEQRRIRRRSRDQERAELPREAQTLLEALPAIGPARARAILAAFGSIRDVALADVEALTRVPGIGPLIAARLLHALSQRLS